MKIMNFLKRIKEIPHRRLVAMVAIMETPRKDSDELCERLLDMTTNEMNGYPRRFGTDNKTWYKFLQYDSNSGIVAALGRYCKIRGHAPDMQSAEDRVLYFTFVKKLENDSGVSCEVENSACMFTYDGQQGCTICIWQDMQIERDPRLICRKCGQVFDFTLGADMATMESMHDMFLSSGANVITHPSNIEYPSPDLVGAKLDDPIKREPPNHVIEALRSGRHRRWRHSKCGSVQGYPASFFLA